MRVPVSWLGEYVDLPPGASGRRIADALLRIGLEVEAVEPLGADLAGPLVIGQVVGIDEFVASNRKTIRYCQVDVGEAGTRGIICGAQNFRVGDKVIVALPGAVLPGGFAIEARKAYGHLSDGMICSARELRIGDDHTGIVVVDPDAPVGVDAAKALDLRDDVLDIAVSPDRGYCLSVRGVARELAVALDTGFRDPAEVQLLPGPGTGWPVRIEDPVGCDRFVAWTVTGINAAARTPFVMRRRLWACGMRPISLAVDVTNYVMLELGQPLHAYDATKLRGPIGVRRARSGERLTTLDAVDRTLDPGDLLIVDDSGPIGLAGTMGGATTEIDATSTDVVLEAAHFDAVSVARMARRHKLATEASRRFERGVDPQLPPVAAARAADLLARHGGARIGAVTDVGAPAAPAVITIPSDHPDRVAGLDYGPAVVVRRLEQIGCQVRAAGGRLDVVPPSWRPDLTDPNDLAEEVIRLEGYDRLPSVLPRAPVGRGLTEEQRRRRLIGRVLAARGYVEVLSYPFMAADIPDRFGLPAADPRRRTVRLANPLDEGEPLLRTTLLPGLFAVARRNLSRGAADLALFEIGVVFLGSPTGQLRAPRPGVDRRPTEEELAALDAALPEQPLHLAVVLVGAMERRGWWGTGRPAGWADAIEAMREVAGSLGVALRVAASDMAPWHPGRCAALAVGDGQPIGFAGELHPRVLAALELPPRTCAAEINVTALLGQAGGPVQAPVISTFPVANLDVAVVVDAGVPAAEVEAALRTGAGPLLEEIRLFDVYRGPQLGAGRKSLAYTLRFRAPDRTLETDEVIALRDAAVAEAARRVGAVLRG